VYITDDLRERAFAEQVTPVYFNWKLLQLPMRIADYVIAHELAHLLEPHHGPDLWRILDRSLPDWRDQSEELKVKARNIYWCNDGVTIE
jgi:predicted metal-dependent hydrolase